MLSDLRDAFRQLTKSPAFSAIIILTLGLGIGANTAIFSFFYGILLRPLPFEAPDRLAQVRRQPGIPVDVKFSPQETQALREDSRRFDAVAVYSAEIATLSLKGSPEALYCAITSRDFFTILGARAWRGTVYSPDDFSGATPPGRLAVISHVCWQTHFAGNPEVVGQVALLNGVPFTIAGVMPPGFEFPRWVDAWLSPARSIPEPVVGPEDDKHDKRYLSIVGRLAEGASFREAETEINELLAQRSNRTSAHKVSLEPLRERTIGNARSGLAMLLGCVGLVLLIACFNIASLLLSRATTRQREMGIRTALGGSRWQISRQLLTESMLLAVLGGLVGILLALWATDLLVAVAPTELPRLSEVRLDSSALSFAIGITVLAGIVCGLAPIWHATSLDLMQAMKADDRTSSSHTSGVRMRGALVAGQVAVSLVLMLVAGLLLRSFWHVSTVDLGIKPSGVISARVAFAGPEYASVTKRVALYREVARRTAELHGVESVGLSWDQPVNESWMHDSFTVANTPPTNEPPVATLHAVSPGYFRTLKIALIQGRSFTAEDDENAPRVAIINTTLARRFFPEGNAIGKHLALGSSEPSELEIVGVVADVRHDGPEAPSGYNIYQPYPQNPIPSFFVLLRTAMDVATARSELARIVHAIDPELPVSYAADLAQTVAWPGMNRRFSLVLVTLFAALALILATVGIYGVLSFSVQQRRREIGIRMALGARRGEVLALVMKHGLKIVGAGVGIGLLGGVIASHLLRRFLFETSQLDWLTFAIVPAVIGTVAVFACWMPARSATRLDSAHTIRVE